MLVFLARLGFFVGSLVSGVLHLALPMPCAVGVARLPCNARWVHTHWAWPTQSARPVLDKDNTPRPMAVFAPQVPLKMVSDHLGAPSKLCLFVGVNLVQATLALRVKFARLARFALVEVPCFYACSSVCIQTSYDVKNVLKQRHLMQLLAQWDSFVLWGPPSRRRVLRSILFVQWLHRLQLLVLMLLIHQTVSIAAEL
jgi:hypothetical protein